MHAPLTHAFGGCHRSGPQYDWILPAPLSRKIYFAERLALIDRERRYNIRPRPAEALAEGSEVAVASWFKIHELIECKKEGAWWPAKVLSISRAGGDSGASAGEPLYSVRIYWAGGIRVHQTARAKALRPRWCFQRNGMWSRVLDDAENERSDEALTDGHESVVEEGADDDGRHKGGRHESGAVEQRAMVLFGSGTSGDESAGGSSVAATQSKRAWEAKPSPASCGMRAASSRKKRRSEADADEAEVEAAAANGAGDVEMEEEEEGEEELDGFDDALDEHGFDVGFDECGAVVVGDDDAAEEGGRDDENSDVAGGDKEEHVGLVDDEGLVDDDVEDLEAVMEKSDAARRVGGRGQPARRVRWRDEDRGEASGELPAAAAPRRPLAAPAALPPPAAIPAEEWCELIDSQRLQLHPTDLKSVNELLLGAFARRRKQDKISSRYHKAVIPFVVQQKVAPELENHARAGDASTSLSTSILSSSPVVTHNEHKLAVTRRDGEIVAVCAMVFVNGRPLEFVGTSRRRVAQNMGEASDNAPRRETMAEIVYATTSKEHQRQQVLSARSPFPECDSPCLIIL